MPSGSVIASAELARVDDLVGRDVLEQPVLVDAGLVRERVRADDRLVGRHGVAREPLDEPRGGADLRDVDVRVCARSASPRTRIAITISSSEALPARSPMPFTVHSSCCDAGVERCERVRDREPEVVVAVGGERDLLELGAAVAYVGG